MTLLLASEAVSFCHEVTLFFISDGGSSTNSARGGIHGIGIFVSECLLPLQWSFLVKHIVQFFSLLGEVGLKEEIFLLGYLCGLDPYCPILGSGLLWVMMDLAGPGFSPSIKISITESSARL